MKRSGILLSVLLMILFSTSMAFASEDQVWLPKHMETPEEFDIDMVVTLDDVGTLVADIPVYPGTSTKYLGWAVNEEWYQRYYVVNLVPQANGHYDITVLFTITNPSKKWAYAMHQPGANPDPYSMVDADTLDRYYSFKDSYLWPKAALILWDSYSENVVGIRIIADVVANGKIKILEFGNQLRTDINEDGVVNIRDITTVAVHYLESYPEDGFKNYDVLTDHEITYEDVIAVAKEFGREIPP